MSRINVVVLFICLSFAWTSVPTSASELPADAMSDWQDMRFGMFIHWGPVALTGHEIGWSRGKQTPTAEYDQLYKRFNPVNFSADEWAQAARAAGMKYMVITTKHHDGFCLWPSEATDYDIGETPFKRDVLKELSAACRKEGLKFGTYYSTCDWYHPDFPLTSPGGRVRRPTANLDRYVDYLRKQVTELVENYGPLCTMWFDVPQEVGPAHGKPTVEMLRKLQPDLVINNRAYREKGKHVGDYDTPEQHVGGFNRERPWETCMTICRQWAWKPNDSMKSLQQCVQTMLHVVGGDGNFLFNVGPTADGIIEARQIERLKEMGDWLNTYGDGVYGTRGGPFKPGKWGAATCKGDSIYVYVMRWSSNDQITLPAIDAKILAAETLSGGAATCNQTSDGITLSLPAADQDAIATVIRLQLDQDAFSLDPVAVVHRSNSLAYGKKAQASNVFMGKPDYRAALAFDDDPETRWATDAGTAAATLAIDLGQVRTVSRVHIDERTWNRVQAFRLEYRVGDEWQSCLNGTHIGENFAQSFDPVTAQEFRLNILAATEGPTIWEVQLFPPE